MTLSAALIVKNEERYLAACLESIRNLVDDVVLVDTGSDDSTVEIARQFGCKIFHFPWQQDFSAARNFGLEQVRADWVLYIDADERVRPGSDDALRDALDDPACIAGKVLLHPMPRFTPFWILRLFRNHPLIRFRGCIHENIWPGVLAYQASYGGEVRSVPLVLDHEGYSGDQTAKHERNLPLLLRAIEATPRRIYCWCHLADVYVALGREQEAVEAWQTAIGIVRDQRDVLPDDSLPYQNLIHFEMSKDRDAGGLIQDARQRFPLNLQLAWLDARYRMFAGKFDEAIVLFEWLIERGRAQDFERSIAYEERLLNALPYEAIATCHFRMGNFAESRRAYAAAAAFEPDRIEYRVKQALCAQMEAK